MYKTPRFWATKNLISLLLFPLSSVYSVLVAVRQLFKLRRSVNIPVICVGNLIAGGSGKTPAAIAIGKILRESGVNYAFLSRGYGAEQKEFLAVRDFEKNAARKFGDEPMILAEVGETFIAEDRLGAAREIEKLGNFQAIVLDDGMQNSSLEANFTILVVDGKIGFGNGFLLPAGPMRESLAGGLERADLVLVIGDADEELLDKFSGKKVVRAKVVAKNLEKFSGKKLFAFCGIAYPQKFFSLIYAEETREFPDHYFYSNHDLDKLYKDAQKLGAELITTRKDWVKFPPEFHHKVSCLDIELEIEDKEFLKAELLKIVAVKNNSQQS